jgi:hypothetical protein
MDTTILTKTPPGEWSRRTVQRRCVACGQITLEERCPRCGQLGPWRREEPDDPPSGRSASAERKAGAT